MKIVLKFILPIFVLVAVVFWFIRSLTPTAVVASVERGAAVRAVPGTLEVLAAKEMDVRGEGHGRVLSSILDAGVEVEAGELLVQLDTGDLDITLERSLFELEAAEANREIGSAHRFSLESAQERLEDQIRRFESGSASSSAVDAHKREVQLIEETIARESTHEELRINQMKNQIKGLRRQLEQRKITAPVAGTIIAVYAFEGDLIGAGQTVARIISKERVVEVKVGEENFAGLEVGQKARVKFLGYGSALYDAHVQKVLPVADPATRRYTLHLAVDIEEDKLFPGLTGEARITIDERADALVIPIVALEGHYVFHVKNDIVELRVVTKGYSNLTDVEIIDGLDEGDLVIIESLEMFKDGDSVRTLLAE